MWILRETCSATSDAHGLLEGAAHFRRLAEAMAKLAQAMLEHRLLVVLGERDAINGVAPHHVGQLDAARHAGIAHDAERIASGRNFLHLGEEALPHHGNADIAAAEMLLAAIGNGPLPDPGDDVLVDDVAVDPAAVRVLDGALPGRNAVLHERFAALRHAHEEPRDRQRVLVVDRYAPLEMHAEKEADRPQRDAADGPLRIALVAAFAHALVDETVLELLELELEMLRRIGGVGAFEPRAPVVVHPLEVHRIDRVLLALKPVARHVGS